MYIENPEKLLSTPIFGTDGQLWIVCECIRLAVGTDGPTYEFKLITDVPVKSSPNQQYYHSTRRIHKEVKLRLTETDYGKHNVYSVSTDEKVWRGYCKDIDTMDKFILVLADLLPNTNNL